MSAKTLLLVLIGLVSLVSSAVVPDTLLCNEPSKANADNCESNIEFVNDRRIRGDLSVFYSEYLNINQEFYKNNTLLKDVEYTGQRPEVLSHAEPSEPVFSYVDDEKIKEALSTSLGDPTKTDEDYKDSNWYVVFAAIDLMNIMYTKVDKERNPSGYKSWKFSTQMVLDEIKDPDDKNDIMYVMYYLENTGVCEAEKESDPKCDRYRIDGYINHYQDPSNQALIDLIAINPLYVQIGVNPTYFQFHSPNSEHPIHSGYGVPTHCGVLTGYDFSVKGKEFWEIYIRRHGDNYNRVKLGCVFEKDGTMQIPFAGVTTKMIEIAVENTNPYQEEVVLKHDESSIGKITNTAQLLEYLEKNGYTSDTKRVVLYERLFDCTDGPINIYDVFTPNHEVYNITIVSADEDDEDEDEGDMEIEDCLNFYKPGKPDMYLELTSEEEYESRVSRRLGDIDLSEINNLKNGTYTVENQYIRGLKIGNNLKNKKKYEISIKNCKSLQSITIGDGSFLYAKSLTLQNNASLEELNVGTSSLGGRPAMHGSELTMENLSELKTLVWKDHALDNFINANVKNVNKDKISIDGDEALKGLKDYNSNNINDELEYYLSLRKTTQTPTDGPSKEPSVGI